MEWSQVELIALPEEDEGTHDIAHGKECHPVGSTQEHDGEGDPVGGEKDDHLHHVQVIPARLMVQVVSKGSVALEYLGHSTPSEQEKSTAKEGK